MSRRVMAAVVLGVVEGALLVRLIALLFAARPDNGPLGVVLTLTAPLVYPFSVLDRLAGQPVYGARLELATIAALLLLPVAATLLVALRAPRRMES